MILSEVPEHEIPVKSWFLIPVLGLSEVPESFPLHRIISPLENLFLVEIGGVCMMRDSLLMAIEELKRDMEFKDNIMVD